MNFEKTIGFKKQKELFQNAWQNGRLAHAYALAGEAGIGKTTFALDFAKVLGADPILDTVLCEADGLSVEQAREIQGRLSLTSAGSHKVAVIVGAENLTPAAANSLLKTLEEPPAHSLIFLVTNNFHGLLPTLASRVQRINFGRASDEEVRKILTGFNLPAEKTDEIVKLARGRIGIAKSLAETGATLEQWEIYKKYYEQLATGSLVTRLQTSETVAALETSEIKDFLRFAMEQWSDVGTSRRIAQKLLSAYHDLNMNVNAKLAMDNLFLP